MFIVMMAMMAMTVRTVNQVEGEERKEHDGNDGKDGELMANRLEHNLRSELYYKFMQFGVMGRLKGIDVRSVFRLVVMEYLQREE